MKFIRSKQSVAAPASPSSPVGRRGLVVGAGVAGAAAVAAHALHRGVVAPPVATTAKVAPVEGEGEGYRLTAHVRRYYETTKA